MFLALDVHYASDHVRGAAVAFATIADPAPHFVLVDQVPGAPAGYESGRFALRELPYLIRLVSQARTRLVTAPDELGPASVSPMAARTGSVAVPARRLASILVDGHVWLGEGRPGLGHFLYEALGRSTPVIGIAKTRYRGAPAGEVRRGTSDSPLFVTSVGVERSEAERWLAGMHGAHRVPTLLKLVDRASRGDHLGPPIAR